MLNKNSGGNYAATTNIILLKELILCLSELKPPLTHLENPSNSMIMSLKLLKNIAHHIQIKEKNKKLPIDQ